MPPYTEINAAPNPTAQAAGKFGQGFSSNLQATREQQRKVDLLNQLLGDQQQPQQPPQNQMPQAAPRPPDNITPTLNNVAQHPDMLAKQGVVSGPNPQSNRNNRITPEKMARIEAIDPSLGKALKPVYESQTKKELEQTKADTKRSGDFLAAVDKTRQSIPRKKLALRQIEDAVATRGNLDAFRSQLADITGLESLRSAKGAQLRSATKEFFISDLNGIPGIRFNQFLEKTLSSAMTDDSRINEANEMLVAGMRSNLQLDEVKSALTAQMEEQYRNTLGYVPYNISSEVEKQLLPYAQQLYDNWANEVQHIEERHNPQIQKFVKAGDDPKQRKLAAKNVKLKEAIPGSILDETMGMLLLEKYDDDEERAMKAAKQLGYQIPGE